MLFISHPTEQFEARKADLLQNHGDAGIGILRGYLQEAAEWIEAGGRNTRLLNNATSLFVAFADLAVARDRELRAAKTELRKLREEVLELTAGRPLVTHEEA